MTRVIQGADGKLYSLDSENVSLETVAHFSDKGANPQGVIWAMPPDDPESSGTLTSGKVSYKQVHFI